MKKYSLRVFTIDEKEELKVKTESEDSYRRCFISREEFTVVRATEKVKGRRR